MIHYFPLHIIYHILCIMFQLQVILTVLNILVLQGLSLMECCSLDISSLNYRLFYIFFFSSLSNFIIAQMLVVSWARLFYSEDVFEGFIYKNRLHNFDQGWIWFHILVAFSSIQFKPQKGSAWIYLPNSNVPAIVLLCRCDRPST